MTIIYSIFVGIIGGLLWGNALKANISTALFIGGIVGIIVGFLVYLLGKAAKAGSNIQKGEATFVNNSIITVFAVFVIGTGLVAWIIRLIFF